MLNNNKIVMSLFPLSSLPPTSLQNDLNTNIEVDSKEHNVTDKQQNNNYGIFVKRNI